jgi:SanA protein
MNLSMTSPSTTGAAFPDHIPRWRTASRFSRRPRLPRKLKRVALAVALIGTGSVAFVAAINLIMMFSVSGQSTTVADAPHAQTAIVLGALVNADGSMSPMLADRVHRGAELYKAGKVDRIIVSGDHHTWAYDEPDTMRKALQAEGVPARAIFTDHAGFNTWASMVRARKVFAVKSAIVVTQGFHMTRALYLANHAGLTATGVTSDIQNYGRQQQLSTIREIPARLKAFGSATFNTRVLLGPVLPVAGDGRTSWGPQHPPSSPR